MSRLGPMAATLLLLGAGDALVTHRLEALHGRRVTRWAVSREWSEATGDQTWHVWPAKGADGASLLTGRRTTCLPKYLERTAYFLTAWKLGRYYRTYDAYVEEEVREALGPDGQFERGPRVMTRRGTQTDDGPAFAE